MTRAKLHNPFTRATEEWIGATPDAKVPPRVRLRIKERYHSKCHWSGREIGPADLWDVEDIIAVINGGVRRESNMAPILRDKHREKTKLDMKVKRKITKGRMRHNGIRGKSRFATSRDGPYRKKLDGTIEKR
jgi:5-methylcytosine-specific restriction protein A